MQRDLKLRSSSKARTAAVCRGQAAAHRALVEALAGSIDAPVCKGCGATLRWRADNGKLYHPVPTCWVWGRECTLEPRA